MTGRQYTGHNKWFYENVRPSYQPFFNGYKALSKNKYSDPGVYKLPEFKIHPYVTYQNAAMPRYEPLKTMGYQKFEPKYQL